MLRKQFLIIFFFSIHLIFSQTPRDTLVAQQYFKKADSLSEIGKKHKKSIVFFKKALSIYKQHKLWKRVAICYNKISKNQRHIRQLEESIDNAQKALTISNKHLSNNNNQKADAYDNKGLYYDLIPEYDKAFSLFQKALVIRRKIDDEDSLRVAISYGRLANVFYGKEMYDEALTYFDKVMHIKLKKYGENDKKLLATYNGLGIVYKRKGNYDKSLLTYKKAIDIVKKQPINNKNQYIIAALYFNTGNVLSEKKEYENALQYFRKSMRITKHLYGENHINLSLILSSIGIIYGSKNDFNSSIKYFKESLLLKQKLLPKNHPLLALSYTNIGVSLLREEKYNESLKYLQKTLSIELKKPEKKSLSLASAYTNIGRVFFKKKENTTALNYYQKSLEVYKKALRKKKHPLLAKAYNEIGDIYLIKKKYETALLYYKKALTSNNTVILNQHFDFTKYMDCNVLLYSLRKISKSYHDQYIKLGHNNLLINSLKYYKTTDSLIDYMRQNLNYLNDKIFLAKEAKEIYTEAIKLQLLRYKNTRDKQDLELAFYYSEKSKANVLKELLNETNAEKFSGIPSSILELKQNLKTDRAFYQSKINEKYSKQSIDSLDSDIISYKNKLFKINTRQDSISNILQNEYPKYDLLKYKNQVISISEIQKKINEKTNLLQFFTSDSITFVFVISKNNTIIKELTIPNLKNKIKKLQEAITIENSIHYKELSYTLYKKLIHPIANEIKGDQLIIIPDGSLWHLNFDLLLTQKESTTTKSENLSYLLRDYAISYANSATLLFNSLKSNIQPKTQKQCLGFSFSDNTNNSNTQSISFTKLRDTEDDLPGTHKEIKAIANIMDGHFYSGNQAIETNFKQHANKYNILHLALHGEVDNENPENSRLYFTKTRDSIEDNLLYSHELFTLNIPAELAVLSACNTGAGKIAKGEGIMSLGNAFQYAGTKSLLLSSWEVSDKTTPELMKYFYTNLKKGMNKAKALQQAKLQYLHTAEVFYTNPFYWGSFYLIGDTAPIDFQNKTYTIYWSIGLIIAVFLGTFFCKRKTISSFFIRSNSTS